MAKYTVTHSCGHEEVVNLIGPHRDREWRMARMEEEVCHECYLRQLAAENAKAAEENKKNELPALTGSEKQVAWAESIRAQRIASITETVRKGQEKSLLSINTNAHSCFGRGRWFDPEDAPKGVTVEPGRVYEFNGVAVYVTTSKGRIADAALDRILNETSARWWIDNRLEADTALYFDAARACLALETTPEPVEREVKAADDQVRIEATVRPTNVKTETVAEIRTCDGEVQIAFPERHDGFRTLVKDLGYRWADGHWSRNVGKFAGTPRDRAAEAGNRILAAGFPIRIYDAAVRQSALDGAFAPEATRWVKATISGQYEGWFAISWGMKDDFYGAAKRISGSRWNSEDRDVAVPGRYFEEVLDFAEKYGFAVSDGARKLAENARTERDAVLVADAAKVAREKPVKASKTPEPLPMPEAGVDAELRDPD